MTFNQFLQTKQTTHFGVRELAPAFLSHHKQPITIHNPLKECNNAL
jgi:hypothetical protein